MRSKGKIHTLILTCIVRDRGNPQTKEFVYRRWTRNNSNKDVDDMVYDLTTAYQKCVYHAKGLPDSPESRAKVSELANQAPNLTLNVPRAITDRAEIVVFAFVGVLVQVLILVISAFTTYYWRFQSGGSAIAAYGYPCFLIGTRPLTLLEWGHGCGKAYPGSVKADCPQKALPVMNRDEICTQEQPLGLSDVTIQEVYHCAVARCCVRVCTTHYNPSCRPSNCS
jgi:hypothetical protein